MTWISFVGLDVGAFNFKWLGMDVMLGRLGWMLMTLYIFIPTLILAYSSWLSSNPKDIKPSELLGSLSRLGSMTLLWSGSQLGQSKRPATYLRLVLLLYMRYPYPDHLIPPNFKRMLPQFPILLDPFGNDAIILLCIWRDGRYGGWHWHRDSWPCSEKVGEEIAAKAIDEEDFVAAVVECEDFMDAVAEGDDSIATVEEDDDLIAAMGVRKNTRRAGNNVHITTSRPDVSDSKGSTCTWLWIYLFFLPLLKAPHIFLSTAITLGWDNRRCPAWWSGHWHPYVAIF